MGKVCIIFNCKLKNDQFPLYKLHGHTGFSIILLDDAHILCFYTYVVIKTDSCFSSMPLNCGKQGITMLSYASCILGALQAISLQTCCVYIIPLLTLLSQLLIFSFATKHSAPVWTLRVVQVSPRAG